MLFAEKIDARLSGPLYQLVAAVERPCRRECDIIDGRAATADPVYRVLRDDAPVVERDRSARIAFEVERRTQ